MMEQGSETVPVVLFDGGCPLCRREIEHYQRVDGAGRLRWIDIHAQPDAVQAFGLNWQDSMQRLHLVEADGRLRVGVAAFVAIWQRLPRYRALAWLVSLPGVHWMAEKAYRGFAVWRWRRRCDEMCVRP